MKSIFSINQPKTWFIDLDGTLVVHNGYKNGGDVLLDGVKEFFENLPKEDFVIITTSRDVNFKIQTVNFLKKNNIRFNDIIPTSADTTTLTTTLNTAPVISEIIPAWRTTVDSATVTSMADLIFENKPFGLRYDTETRTWKIVFESNLNTVSQFSLGRQGDST